MSSDSDIFLISYPLTLPPPLGVPMLTCLFISMEKLFVIFPKVSLDALSVASFMDKLIRLSVDMAKITNRIINDFKLFLVTYAKAFLINAIPPNFFLLLLISCYQVLTQHPPPWQLPCYELQLLHICFFPSQVFLTRRLFLPQCRHLSFQ